MKKKFLLFLLGVLIGLPIMADDFEYTYKGKTFKYEVIDENKQTCKLIGPVAKNDISGNVVLPDYSAFNKKNGASYTIIEFGTFSFAGCPEMTSITIPFYVETIGENAFSGCSGLISITIPSSVKTIEASAFNGCSGLTKAKFSSIKHLCSIKFEDSNSNPLSYAKNLWIDGKEVTELVIPDEVTSIGANAFISCTGLTSVTIGNSVTDIGSSAFQQCTGLTSVTIGNSVTDIGWGAFQLCTGLTSVTLGNSVSKIGDAAFSGCAGLTSIHFPNSVSEIGYAFSNCTGLTTVTIGSRLDTKIKPGAFLTCTGLVRAAYPKSIKENPFSESVFVVAYDPVYKPIYKDGYLMTPYTTNGKPELLFAPYVPNGKYAVPDEVTKIREDAFAMSLNMTHITIPDKITEIQDRAFSKCPALVEVTFPKNLNDLGEEVFSDCKNIKDVIYRGTTAVKGWTDVFDDEVYAAATLHVPSDCTASFSTVNPWKNFLNISDAPFTAVDEVIADEDGIDYTLPYSVYNLKGQMTGNSVEGLVPGMYIVRQGSKVKKMVVK